MQLDKKKIQKTLSQAGLSYVMDECRFAGKAIKYLCVNADCKSLPLVVFIHGAPGYMIEYSGYLKPSPLTKNARLLIVERPGYGSGQAATTAITEQAQAIKSVIDGMRAEKVALVGHSYGAPIAAKISVISQKISGLLMIAPVADPESERLVNAANIVKSSKLNHFLPKTWKTVVAEKAAHAAELRAMTHDWGKISCPATIIHGKYDLIASFKHTEFLYKKLKEVKEITLLTPNHYLHLSRRKLIIKEIMNLLQPNFKRRNY